MSYTILLYLEHLVQREKKVIYVEAVLGIGDYPEIKGGRVTLHQLIQTSKDQQDQLGTWDVME